MNALVIVPSKDRRYPLKYWRGDENKRGSYLLGARVHGVPECKAFALHQLPRGVATAISGLIPGRTVLEGNGPEYETIAMMGSNLLVEDLGAVAMGNDLANRMGIDTISCGALIGFLM